ncbi:hypothetical protein, partial [Halomonas halodenitrificans]|uniref:hypothetical protein n=1 Tax=Halomonas halodenitrificans TaxID=28252 RepID=UPI00146FBA28
LAKANLHGANGQKMLAGGDRGSVGAGFTDSGVMNIPKHAGKTSADQLDSIKCSEFAGTVSVDTPFQYYKTVEGKVYDFLWSPKKETDKLFVFFSGDILRDKNNPPVYQRWSWAPFFPGHCVYFSDPSLKLSNDLSLAWYSGGEDFDPLCVIAGIIDDICECLNILPENVVAYGSSGGGFAAIRLLQYLQGATAVAINPQTNLDKYYKSKVKCYLERLYPSFDYNGAFDSFSKKLSLFDILGEMKGREIVYVQNLADAFHLKNHAEPFYVSCESNGVSLKKLFFEDERGHGVAESQAAFDEIMSVIS